MKTTFRLPSKAIQYGYVEVDFDLPDQTPPDTLGNMYVNFVHAFLGGEQRGLNALLEPSQSEPEVGSPEAAKQRLEAGQKPRTAPEADEMVAQLIKQELGATVVGEEETKKPWGQKIHAPKKPWEDGGATPKVASIEW